MESIHDCIGSGMLVTLKNWWEIILLWRGWKGTILSRTIWMTVLACIRLARRLVERKATFRYVPFEWSWPMIKHKKLQTHLNMKTRTAHKLLSLFKPVFPLHRVSVMVELFDGKCTIVCPRNASTPSPALCMALHKQGNLGSSEKFYCVTNKTRPDERRGPN